MNTGDRIADYLNENRGEIQRLHVKLDEKLAREGWRRAPFREIHRRSDGTAVVVTRDSNGYYVYGPYLTWKPGE